MVNAITSESDNFWASLSINNLIKRASGKYSLKIFLWNHDHENEKVKRIIKQYDDNVIELTANDVDFNQYDPDGKYICKKGYRFHKGYDVHRTPLQLLYNYLTAKFDVEVFFTFDTDSWPLRNNWDLPLMYALNSDKKLVGVWRDELKALIPPYVHPSCLGMRNDVFKKSGLRFDKIPSFPLEDSLSHFTKYVCENYGEQSIFKLIRNNGLQYHPVFNGVYGSLIYHHHFGSRHVNIKTGNLKSFGWEARKENMQDNYIVMVSTTKMIFSDMKNIEIMFTYGYHSHIYHKYYNYLRDDFSKTRAFRLFSLAKNMIQTKPMESFMIFNILNSYDFLKENGRFRASYAHLLKTFGYDYESLAYLNW